MFAVHQAKRVGYGVGGATQIYVLPRSLQYAVWDEKQVAELTERAMRLCLVDARDLSMSVEQIEAFADNLCEDIVKLRRSVEAEKNTGWIKDAIQVAARQQSIDSRSSDPQTAGDQQ